MRVNVFIRKENEDKWKQIKDKSAWINQLLSGTPGTPDAPVVPSGSPQRPVLSDAERFKLPPDPETGWPCCSGDINCRHWQWNSDQAIYINSLTGKIREPQGF